MEPRPQARYRTFPSLMKCPCTPLLWLIPSSHASLRPLRSLIYLLTSLPVPEIRIKGLIQPVLSMSSSLPSPSLMLGWIHRIAWISNAFLFTAEWYSFEWMCHNFSVHDEHWDCLSGGVIMGKVAMDVIRVFVWTCFHLSWVNGWKRNCWFLG